MRQLTNLFIVLFLFAATLGIIDQLLMRFLQPSPLAELRSLADLIAVLLGLVLYFGMSFNRHLPKLILLPLIASLLWGLLDFWPLPKLLGANSSALFAACGQLLLGLLAIWLIRAGKQKSWLFIRSQFAGPGFSGRNFCGFALLNIVLLPIILLILGFSAASTLIEQSTAGFARLKPNGLYMVERVYRRGEKNIRLAGMIHMGQQNYYAELIDSIAGRRTIILAEGVSDEEQQLQENFSYGKLAELLGLASQEQFSFKGRLIEAESLDRAGAVEGNLPDILRADIDLKEFDPRTIEVLNALGKYLLGSDSIAGGLSDFNRWAETHLTPEINRVVMHDLLDRRNRSLLGYLPKALRKYDTLVIPWGALHMVGIERGVQELGFSLQQSKERLSVDFTRLPYGKLWQNLIGDSEGRSEQPPVPR